MSATAATDSARNDALQATAQALQRAAGFILPPELDRRILELGERKDCLTNDERGELLAWVAFTQQRSIDIAEARIVLRRLAAAFPELGTQSVAD
jgi:hypothetical protein